MLLRGYSVFEARYASDRKNKGSICCADPRYCLFASCVTRFACSAMKIDWFTVVVSLRLLKGQAPLGGNFNSGRLREQGFLPQGHPPRRQHAVVFPPAARHIGHYCLTTAESARLCGPVSLPRTSPSREAGVDSLGCSIDRQKEEASR
jgi:hypothetical protein